MSTFHFQQFSVIQKASAMKVCTDATLFGAMAPIAGGEKVLDIGSGTGLLSLMAAQLGAGDVTAVEVTDEAYNEAKENFANSPWAERLDAIHQDIREFSPDSNEKYSLIICNPPFFEGHKKADSSLRSTARHSDDLPYSELADSIARLLDTKGHCYLLLPVQGVESFCQLAREKGLQLTDRTDFRGYSRNKAKVTALTFSHNSACFMPRLLTIYRGERVYSDESRHYLSPFLLRFGKGGLAGGLENR